MRDRMRCVLVPSVVVKVIAIMGHHIDDEELAAWFEEKHEGLSNGTNIGDMVIGLCALKL